MKKEYRRTCQYAVTINKGSAIGNFSFLKFKTLSARSIVFLLIPVFFILFLGGVVRFFYTRNVMLNQWNESAELKLQRAAHHIVMRISKPLELLDLLFARGDKILKPIILYRNAFAFGSLALIVAILLLIRFHGRYGFPLYPMRPKNAGSDD